MFLCISISLLRYILREVWLVKSVYGDSKKTLAHDAPIPVGKSVLMTNYIDANLYHAILIGRSVTGI